MALLSPYEIALGARLHELHPVLQRYFAAVPPGHIGVGEGVFSRVGTPRRWLWPALGVLERRGVVYAGEESDVAFRIVNRTLAGPDGTAITAARRELRMPRGTWIMIDAVSASPSGVVDRLGDPATVAASFSIDVRGGMLVLESRSVGVRIGRLRLRAPSLCAPRIRLTERFDDDVELQRVAVTVDVPVLGRVYAYEGHFRYDLVPDPGGDAA